MKVCPGYKRVTRAAADHQAQYPDGRDDCTQYAVSEDGKVCERSNNNTALDDRHGSQVPERTEAESVHTAVDYSEQPNWNLFTGLERPRDSGTAGSNYTVDDVGDGQ